MSRKITIPEGSIIILPKSNLQIDAYLTLGDFTVEEKEVTVYVDFAEYKNERLQRRNKGSKNV